MVLSLNKFPQKSRYIWNIQSQKSRLNLVMLYEFVIWVHFIINAVIECLRSEFNLFLFFRLDIPPVIFVFQSFHIGIESDVNNGTMVNNGKSNRFLMLKKVFTFQYFVSPLQSTE